MSNEHNAGTIKAWGGVVIPSGWLLCDGRAISRQNYKALFSVISTTYGEGDGINTFNLPDTRENVLVGADQNTTHNISTHDVYNLGEFKDDQFQGHRHTSMQLSLGREENSPNYLKFVSNSYYTYNHNVGDPISDGSNGTPRIGSTTHTKQLGINYIIKY